MASKAQRRKRRSERDMRNVQAESRHLKAAYYDSADTNQHNASHWSNANGLSAGLNNSSFERSVVRNRARYEVANNSYAAGIARTIADDTISHGPTIRFNSESDELNRKLDTLFAEWADAVQLAEKLRTMRISRLVDGEAFALLFENPRNNSPIKLNLRLYEADQWDASVTGDFLDETGGIILDDFGNPIGYSFYKYHPGGGRFTFENTTIPAPQVIHWFRPSRPGQYRGISELQPALGCFAELRDYTQSVLGAADLSASLAGVLESNDPDVGQDSVVFDPFDTVDIPRRTLMTLPDGYKLSQLKSEQPVSTYTQFVDTILREIGRSLCLPFNIVSGSSAGYNFSSARMDYAIYRKTRNVDRREIEKTIIAKIMGDWQVEAIALLGLHSKVPYSVSWPADAPIDPVKEGAAAINLIREGLLTEKDYADERGLDYETIERQRAYELAMSVEEYRAFKRARLLNEPIVPIDTKDDED